MYGCFLSLVGETKRRRHCGARVTAGVVGQPPRSHVLRTKWDVAKHEAKKGGDIYRRTVPDWQQILTQVDVVAWLDSGDESGLSLEHRVVDALTNPGSADRFGGWSLGESTFLVNDIWLLPDGKPPVNSSVFVADPDGNLTLPTWVDHVGFAGTRYATGRLATLDAAPAVDQLPRIDPT